MFSTRDGSRDRTGSPDIELNLFPAKFIVKTTRVLVGPWCEPEALDALRQAEPDLATWRDPDDTSRMFAWYPNRPVPERLAHLSVVTITLDEAPRVYERLLADAVRVRFLEMGFKERGRGYVNYAHSHLAKIGALADASAEPIGIYSKIIPDVFFTRSASGDLVFGLVLDVLYATRLDVSVAEWISAGLNDEVIGTYVQLLSDSPEANAFAELSGRVVGRVSGLRDGKVVLTDLRDSSLREVRTTSVAPEPTRPNLERYLGARYESAFRDGERELGQKLRALVQPRRRAELAAAALKRLLKREGKFSAPLEIVPGVLVDFGAAMRAGSATFPVRTLLGPTYSFDPVLGQEYSRVDIGLQRYGPYDVERQRHTPRRVLVLAPVEHQVEVQRALRALRDGISTRQNVFTGLRAMYRMEQISFIEAFVTATGRNPMVGYTDAAQRAFGSLGSADPPFDLALVVIRELDRNLPDSENPYFATKSLLLALSGVPTQAVTIEKIQKGPYDLQYILNTMALACYAKMGGTSHVLKTPVDEEAPTELVFGIGRKVTREDRFGEAIETIGFATVFRANGEYVYNDSTPYCAAGEYGAALESTVRRAIEQAAAFEQLRDDAPLRLVFHVSRRTGRHEVQPILNAIRKLPRYRVEFALLHVNEDHDLLLFDRANENPADQSMAYLPPRGLSLALGPRERLVTFVGPQQYRGYGCPGPIRLTLDKSSTFTDLDYLTQQLYQLSFMSAGSLSPGVTPVTINYARRLADLTGHLRGVQRWSVEMIQLKLGRKLWFI